MATNRWLGSSPAVARNETPRIVPHDYDAAGRCRVCGAERAKLMNPDGGCYTDGKLKVRRRATLLKGDDRGN